ncbi:MAG: hypothetical protein COA57_00600 [Flavobacteriales bacterium]|nr:MAG: hypothetical protein COA57_00600 [Flavobacteriales bacterium]
MRRLLIHISLCAIGLASTNLSFSQVRKYSNEFLAIGVGARSLGMSNASVATVNDVTSGYWNPAGLLGIRSNIQIAAMHSEYFAGIAKYDYGALGARIDSSSAIGVSFIRFGVDDIPNTTELIDAEGNINYDNITSFSAADNALQLSYAKKMKIEGLNVGANAKIIYRKVGDMAHSWGFGLDVGAQYDYKGWKLGLMARDITSTFNAWSYSFSDRMIEVWTITNNEIPENSLEVTLPKIILAGGRKFEFKRDFSLLAELNLDVSTDGRRNVLISSDPFSIDPHLGIEAAYKDIVYLRGGIGNIQKEKNELGNRKITTFQPNIGIGLKIKVLSIDYAFTDIGDQSAGLYSHVISLKLDIYKKV